jgi:hypothetical protein
MNFKIQIVIPLWKRPNVTLFCFDQLVKMISESRHEYKVLCVISEIEYVEMCEAYGFQYVFVENFPVGNKINAGIKASLSNSWDYLMMMNSDDVIKAELIDKNYQPFFESGEKFFGINRVTYVKFGTTEALEYSYDYSVLGIGKCMKRDVVELAFKTLKELYASDRNRGLDDSMMDNLMKIRVFPRIVKYDGQLAMDFKSEVNIWPWEHFVKKPNAIPTCYNHQ